MQLIAMITVNKQKGIQRRSV